MVKTKKEKRVAIAFLALISISVSTCEHAVADQCDWSGRFVFFTVTQSRVSLAVSPSLRFANFHESVP